MKRIIIFDEFTSSKFNGVGVFTKELYKQCGCIENFQPILVSFNNPIPNLTISDNNQNIIYSFPVINNGQFLYAGIQIGTVLRLYIKDTPNNVFVINHSPCYAFIKTLKKLYPKSKFVFIIHNQGWNTLLLGDKNLLNKIYTKRLNPSSLDMNTIKYIRKYCTNEKRAYKIADAVICLSQSTKAILLHTYQLQKTNIHLIPNGIERPTDMAHLSTTKAKNQIGIRNDETTILYVGRITKAKGIIDLLHAFDEINKEYTNLRLLIAGIGSEIFQYMESMSIYSRSRVSFFGNVKKEDLETIYAASDICIIPSYSEQCSFAALGMMIRGKLIISSDAIGLKDMFTSNVNALIYSRNDPSISLVNMMRKALNMHPQDKYRLMQECKRTALYKYSQKKQFAQLLTLFTTL